MQPTLAHPLAAESLALYCPHSPSPRQREFLECSDRIAFYGGRAGCGKSDVEIMAALQGVVHGAYNAILLRRTFRELKLSGAILDRARAWFAHSPARWDADNMWFRFPTGARIAFGYLDHSSHLGRYQSAEYHFIGFDEVGEFTPELFLPMIARLRRTVEFPQSFPLRVRGTLNPGGELHDWICDTFGIKPEDVFPERSPELRVTNEGEQLTFFPAHPSDNPGLDWEDYNRSLALLPEIKRLQLKEGRWIKDTEKLCYHGYVRARRVKSLPKGNRSAGIPEPKWQYGLVFDIGASNNCSFAVYAWCDWIDTCYVVHVDEPDGVNTAHDIAIHVRSLEKRWSFEWMTADPGGLGKGYIDELRRVYGLPVHACEKSDKPGHIELFNDAMISGAVQFIEGKCEPFFDQAKRLVWKDASHKEEMTGIRNHSCDSVMYGFRRLKHSITPSVPPKSPSNDTDPFERQLVAEHDAMIVDDEAESYYG